MKSLLLCSLLLFLTYSSSAQILANTKLIGGNISFGHQSQAYPFPGSNSHSYTSFAINSSFGKAVKTNTVNGIKVSYHYQEAKAHTQPTTISNSIEMAVFRQKYLPIGSSFLIFGEGSIGAGYGWRQQSFDGYSISAGLGAGLAYKAGNKLMFTLSFPNAVNAYLGYSEQKFSNGTTIEKATSFNAGLSSTVSIQSLQFGLVLLR